VDDKQGKQAMQGTQESKDKKHLCLLSSLPYRQTGESPLQEKQERQDLKGKCFG
jgi:hypothetical protein